MLEFFKTFFFPTEDQNHIKSQTNFFFPLKFSEMIFFEIMKKKREKEKSKLFN